MFKNKLTTLIGQPTLHCKFNLNLQDLAHNKSALRLLKYAISTDPQIDESVEAIYT